MGKEKKKRKRENEGAAEKSKDPIALVVRFKFLVPEPTCTLAQGTVPATDDTGGSPYLYTGRTD